MTTNVISPLADIHYTFSSPWNAAVPHRMCITTTSIPCTNSEVVLEVWCSLHMQHDTSQLQEQGTFMEEAPQAGELNEI